MEEFVSDVIRHSAEVKAEYPGLPMFLYGHSMGGMISVATVLRNPSFYSGLVLEGPLIIPDPHEVTPTRLLLGRLISPILPEMQMGRVRVEQVTSDTALQAGLTTDKFRWTGGVKLGMGMAFLRYNSAVVVVVVYLWALHLSCVLYLPLEPLQALKIEVIIPLFAADYPTMIISQTGCQPPATKLVSKINQPFKVNRQEKLPHHISP